MQHGGYSGDESGFRLDLKEEKDAERMEKLE